MKPNKTMSDKNTFHLAITMAGAVSAGAYTAGVMDYLLEVLEKWESIKNNDTHKDKLPTHNIKIEILSGASAGGMTACISSIVLHQKDKHHVDFESNEADRKKNRLYNSWVNLGHGSSSMTGNKAIFELLGDKDVKEIEEFKRKTNEEKEGCIEFPISFFDSSIIRKIAEDSTKLDKDDKDEIAAYGLPDYVAKDFDAFVTLTSLKGFKKTISLQKHTTGGYEASYTTTDHRDVMMFNFGKENKQPGIINVNLPTETNDSEGLTLLRNAAVSTGAFPIGLEYGFIERKTEYINKNFLMKQIHKRKKDVDIVSGDSYSSAMIDGGLINNEPFELTKILLQERLKGYKTAARERRYSMLLIDPFPSDSVEISTNNDDSIGKAPKLNKLYPYNFIGAIGQLISVARSQLLVKSMFNEHKPMCEAKDKSLEAETVSMIEEAFDQDEINTFLIAPRRYDDDGNIADGSKAIACGTLGGFGGFLDKSFREHDFFLGRNNCKSFLQSHFKFDADDNNDPESPFYNSYSAAAKKLFLIQNTNSGVEENSKEWLPIIPDVNILLENVSDIKANINAEYAKNKFPRMTEEEFETLFNQLEPKISDRLKLVVDTVLSGTLELIADSFIVTNKLVDYLTGKNFLLGKPKTYVLDELKAWKIVR
jgi:hypothetical protein